MPETNNTPGVGDGLSQGFLSAWIKFISFIPEIITAAIILVVGAIVAQVLGKAVEKLLHYMQVDRVVEDSGVREQGSKYGFHMSISYIVGSLIKVFVFFFALVMASDTLHLVQLSLLLDQFILYIPNVIVAVVIVTAGLVVGEFLYRSIKGSLQMSHLNGADPDFVASGAKYAIVIFAVLAALNQLNVAPHIIEIIAAGVVFALALSFGLGGRDHAAKMLDKLVAR